MQNLVELVDLLADVGIKITCLELGGGMGITSTAETPPGPDEYARAIVATARARSLELILEPGRVIVGNAGILVTRVLYRKPGKGKEFVIADAGMNDLLRPSLYKAFHAVQPVRQRGSGTITADLVGPICESGDFLASERDMADVWAGDLLAVMSAGAYAFTMSSNYCSRLKVPEVMVKTGKFHMVRERQQYADLIRGESIPPFL